MFDVDVDVLVFVDVMCVFENIDCVCMNVCVVFMVLCGGLRDVCL